MHSTDAEEDAVVHLPPVVQDELLATFNVERAALQQKVDKLLEEAAQSQQAFDTYRDRAKQSLMKSVAEQRAAEGAIGILKEQLQVSERGV